MKNKQNRIELETNQTCHIPDAVREHVKVTSWLHEEGTAIEIFPEKVRLIKSYKVGGGAIKLKGT